jgi:hypothetical protein
VLEIMLTIVPWPSGAVLGGLEHGQHQGGHHQAARHSACRKHTAALLG